MKHTACYSVIFQSPYNLIDADIFVRKHLSGILFHNFIILTKCFQPNHGLRPLGAVFP